MVDLRDLDFHLEVVNLQNLAEIMSPDAAGASAGGIPPDSLESGEEESDQDGEGNAVRRGAE